MFCLHGLVAPADTDGKNLKQEMAKEKNQSHLNFVILNNRDYGFFRTGETKQKGYHELVM